MTNQGGTPAQAARILFLGILLGGCASTPSTPPKNPASSTQVSGGCSDAEQTKREGTLLGAVVGAIVGVGVSKATGGSGNDRVLGGMIGAMTGGLIGEQLGKKVAERKEQFCTTNAFLDQEIADTRSAIELARQENSKTQQKIAYWNGLIQALKEDYAAGRSVRDEVAAERAKLRAQQEQTKTTLAQLNTQLSWNQEALKLAIADGQADGKRIQALYQEVAALEDEIAGYQQTTIQLAAVDDRLSF